MPPDATTDVITADVTTPGTITAGTTAGVKITDRLQHTRADGSVEYIEGLHLSVGFMPPDSIEVTEASPDGRRVFLAYVRLAPGESIRYTRRIPVAE